MPTELRSHPSNHWRKKPNGTCRPEAAAIEEDDNQFLAQIAEVWYDTLKRASKQAAPNHLFLGERHQLRATADSVLGVVGRHVDVFLTQALIRSPQRPPEWQVFQQDAYIHEHEVTGKPIVIIDWACPFSPDGPFISKNGKIKTGPDSARDQALWLRGFAKLPFTIGVFKCQLIGAHPNDSRFEKKVFRTHLHNDGTEIESVGRIISQAHGQVLESVYGK